MKKSCYHKGSWDSCEYMHDDYDPFGGMTGWQMFWFLFILLILVILFIPCWIIVWPVQELTYNIGKFIKWLLYSNETH